MTLDVECVSAETTLQEAARRMKLLDVGPMPVCGDDDRLVGMLTDRDIVIRSTAEGLDPRTTKVRDVMTRNVIACYEDQDVEKAVELMEEHRIRRLVVLNREERLFGIVSLGDLAIRANKKESSEVLREVSEPSITRF